MSEEIIAITHREIDRLKLISDCVDKKISKRHGAKALGIIKRDFYDYGPTAVATA